MSDYQIGDQPHDRGPVVGVPLDDLTALRDRNRALEARIEALEAENARRREALEACARGDLTRIEKGCRARAALKDTAR